MIEPIKTKPKAKNPLVIFGLLLTIFGISLYAASALPKTESTVWLNQTFAAPENGYVYTDAKFHQSNQTLHIYFNLPQEGIIDFWVMNESEFVKFNTSQPYEYYQPPSASSIATKEIKWEPPTGRTLYFVWNNPNSTTHQTIYALFKLEYQKPLLDHAVAFFGLPMLFTGLTLIALGLKPLASDSARSEIITGYICAVLGGVIGIILAIILAKKGNLNDKFHTKTIMAIGILAFSLYIISTMF